MDLLKYFDPLRNTAFLQVNFCQFNTAIVAAKGSGRITKLKEHFLELKRYCSCVEALFSNLFNDFLSRILQKVNF